jgi:hypothetical protein
MEQNLKELLLKDLCARLPYGVKFAITNEKTETLKSIGIDKFDLIPINLFYKKPLFYLINEFGNIEYKPYLRSMSSMTEEEKQEFHHVASLQRNYIGDDIFYTHWQMYDWLNAHHFDYRGLIPMGLALEAPKGMYNIKEK